MPGHWGSRRFRSGNARAPIAGLSVHEAGAQASGEIPSLRPLLCDAPAVSRRSRTLRATAHVLGLGTCAAAGLPAVGIGANRNSLLAMCANDRATLKLAFIGARALSTIPPRPIRTSLPFTSPRHLADRPGARTSAPPPQAGRPRIPPRPIRAALPFKYVNARCILSL